MGWYVVALGVLFVGCRAASSGASFDADFEPPIGQAGARAEEATEAQAEAAAGGAPAEPLPRSDCAAELVTMEEIHSGRVRSGHALSVPSLVASSQKFLVSEAKSGSCLWGAFAAGQGKRGAGSGLLLVSFGPTHAEGEACRAGADGLPDDLRPGDVLEVQGTLDSYAPAACEGVAPALQLRIDSACPAQRTGQVSEPQPERIDVELATRLAAGKDAQLLGDWAGALIELDEQSARKDVDDGDAVFPFGAIRLEQTSLEVHSKLYYFDLSAGGPRAAEKSPHFDYPQQFQRIVGVVLLDYCDWVLAPRDRCRDLSPPSAGCAG